MPEQPETDEPRRTCPQCGETKPISDFYTVKAANYSDGMRVKAVCKACDKAGARERMRAFRERAPKPSPKQRGRPVPTPPPGMLRGAEVAARLGISRQRVHVLAQSGRLDIVRAGKAIFYTESSVQALEQERQDQS